MFRQIISVFCFIGLAACASNDKPPPREIPDQIGLNTPIQADWDSNPDGADWTRLTRLAIEEVGGGLIGSDPADMDRFCPGYSGLTRGAEKTAFWVGLISAMSRYESGHDPTVRYEEDFSTSDGRPVISRGLLQLSQESANGYAGCLVPLTDEERLHEPALNLRCGVIILARWVARDGLIADEVSPYRGGARYWAVLRKPDTIAAMADFTRGLDVCGE